MRPRHRSRTLRTVSQGDFGPLRRLTNLIESSVWIDQLSAAGLVGGQRVPLAVTGFDNRAHAELAKTVTAQAVPQQFTSPDRPNDQVVTCLVTIERRQTVQLTQTELSATAMVRVPVAPLLTGEPVPPIRYRTETVWQSGGIGTSPWQETDATILLPIKTVPA